MNQMIPKQEIPQPASQEVSSGINEILEAPVVMDGFRAELMPRIQRIQQENPDLIFPLREDEMKGLVRAYAECVGNGSCLPEEVDDRMINNLKLLKDGRKAHTQAGG